MRYPPTVLEADARILLLQVRNRHDPMREHEVASFARVLGVGVDRVGVLDLLAEGLDEARARAFDLLLLGGSGDYSAAAEGAWLERALDTLRRVHASGTPVFASCWGFQALSRAMGGRVLRDPARAEVGTLELTLTGAGALDPVFAPLGRTFEAQMGHEDVVVELPPRATLLASSAKVENQAFRFDDAPVYCTQFHPELRASDVVLRLRAYPRYVERLAGDPARPLTESLRETPQTEGILARFVEQMV